LPASPLRGNTGHAAAFFSALLTGFGATLAMVGLMLAAFCPARLTNLGAHAANILHKVRPAAHKRRCRPADFSAVLVQPNTFGHFRHVPLAEAGVGAVLAFLGAANARLNARLVFVVRHEILLGGLGEPKQNTPDKVRARCAPEPPVDADLAKATPVLNLDERTCRSSPICPF
jgi:hypothetical protein